MGSAWEAAVQTRESNSEAVGRSCRVSLAASTMIGGQNLGRGHRLDPRRAHHPSHSDSRTSRHRPQEDGFGERTPAARRSHGTSMASLIVHGDLQAGEPPVARPLYVRPVMIYNATEQGETTPPDRLPLDIVYLAVRRLLVGEGTEPASAPSIVVLNLSLGDVNHPFAGRISPWARLIDWLSFQHKVLFLVSAGNVGRWLPAVTSQPAPTSLPRHLKLARMPSSPPLTVRRRRDRCSLRRRESTLCRSARGTPMHSRIHLIRHTSSIHSQIPASQT